MKIIIPGDKENEKKLKQRFLCNTCKCVFEPDKEEFTMEFSYKGDVRYKSICPTCNSKVYCYE